jgi:hypothetical protein
MKEPGQEEIELDAVGIIPMEECYRCTRLEGRCLCCKSIFTTYGIGNENIPAPTSHTDRPQSLESCG